MPEHIDSARRLLDFMFPGDRIDFVDDPTGTVKGDLEKLPPARRGTTNGNARGGSETRRRRREWLVQTYRANEDVVELAFPLPWPLATTLGEGVPACRCYRCGVLLTVDTVTVDRIVPGCRGGTYRRTNIRPACGRCNSTTGATTRRKR